MTLETLSLIMLWAMPIIALVALGLAISAYVHAYKMEDKDNDSSS